MDSTLGMVIRNSKLPPFFRGNKYGNQSFYPEFLRGSCRCSHVEQWRAASYWGPPIKITDLRRSQLTTDEITHQQYTTIYGDKTWRSPDLSNMSWSTANSLETDLKFCLNPDMNMTWFAHGPVHWKNHGLVSSSSQFFAV